MNPSPPQNRGLTAIDGAMVLIIILLIVQIWLLSATLESYLAGYQEAAIPGAIISAILFLACLTFYRFVTRIDSESSGARTHACRVDTSVDAASRHPSGHA
jgi:hypothetical protein